MVNLDDIDMNDLLPNKELIAEMQARFDRAEVEKQRIYRQIEREMRVRQLRSPINRLRRFFGYA